MGQGTIETLANELARAVRPLRVALGSDAAFKGLALRLGWRLDTIPPPLANLGTVLESLETALAPYFAGDSPGAADTVALLEAVHDVFAAVAALSSASFDPALLAQSFGSELPEMLVELLVTDYLVRYHPAIAFAAKALGVMRETHVPRTSARPAFLRRQLAWPDLATLISDPSVLLRNAFGWGTADFDANELMGTLQGLLAAIKIQVGLEPVPAAKAALIDGAVVTDRRRRWCLDAPIYYDGSDTELTAAGVRVLPLPAAGVHLPGVAVMPYALGAFQEEFPLDAHLAFTVRSGVDLEGGVAIRLRPNEPIDIVTGFENGTGSSATGLVSGRIEYRDPELTPWTIVGSASGTRIEAVSVAGVGALRLDAAAPELSLELELLGGRIVIAPGEGDSFLRHILPPDGVAAPFDLAVGLSTTRGLYFRGSGGLAVTLPVHATLGPLSFDSITLGLRVDGGTLRIDAGANLGVELGPVTAVAQGVGVEATVAFPGSGGNLGPFNLDVGFKFPDGVGLQIDGGGFKGGGLIARDPAHGRYTGIVEVALKNTLALTGVGILDTKLPDGTDGYSLFVAIGAQFRAIQLGLGFTLNGVGGIIGVHRTVKVDVIRAGLRDGSLSSLLFPANPVADAAHLVADLERIFPTEQGRYVFGPTMRIGWGTPTLITADIGLLIEVPDPVRIALVGVVRSFLPDADAPLLKLQANFLGTVDLDRGLLSFDASLFDSRLLAFTLEGDVCARLALSPSPNYLLSAGGFHPAYTPPPMDVPAMRRIAISLLGGDNPRLRAEVYFARTSNSFQFGASVELYVGVSEFNVYGFLGFDVLIQVRPVHLAADVKATLAVRVGDDPIMSVGVDFTLEGPQPWRAKGSAHFDICWFLSFSVHFDKTWGDTGGEVAAPAVEVLPLLVAALTDARGWSTRVPAHVHALVALRDTDAAVVDPAGAITVSQKIVPLDLTIDHLGTATPSDGTRFSITDVSVSGTSLDHQPVTEEFAPAEFFSMSDAEKLSRPSFEAYPSGVVIGGAAALVADDVVGRDVSYEQIVVDRVSAGRPSGRSTLTPAVFGDLLRGSAVSRSPLAKNPALAGFGVNVAAEREGYAVASTSDMRLAGSRVGVSYAEALDELRRMTATAPAAGDQLQIVTVSELAA